MTETVPRGARDADVLLSDGSTAHLRQIRPEDAPAIVAMHSRFSERTRYLRYFSPYPRIPERDLRRFVTVDHHDREALVLTSGGEIFAVGRYERLGADSLEAEVAFVVEDAHQGRGIGSVLLEHLAAAARQEGLTRFVAEVLPANGAMLRVFADAGYSIARKYEDGVVHLTFPIAPTELSREVQERREHRTEARSIVPLLSPRAVAVYGASASGQGIGAALLAHLRDGGFTGPVLPIHPSATRVAGLPALRSAVDAGTEIDLALVAVPPGAVGAVVADAARAGVRGLVVVSAGFAETGPVGAAAERELLRAARDAGLRLIGPNCLGIANTSSGVRLNATLAPRLPTAGRVGFFSQSGALGVALLDAADRRGLGLSSFVSAGNRADVSGNDLLQYWQDDPATDVILLYLETFGNPRKFARLARRIGRTKPVVAVASAARPATPDVPGLDPAAVTALFARSGVIRVDTVAEMFDVGVLLAHQPLPAGRRIGVVGNSSALTALAAAAVHTSGLTLAESYPHDVPPAASAHDFADTLADAATDERVDALVAVFAPPLPGQHADEDADFASAVASVALAGEKPTVAMFLAGTLPDRIPSYPSVEEAVRALARVVTYADWLRRPPGSIPDLPGINPTRAKDLIRGYGPELPRPAPRGSAPSGPAPGDPAPSGPAPGDPALFDSVPRDPAPSGPEPGDPGPRAPGVNAPELLASYGIPVVPSGTVQSAADAVAVADRHGYPVALKAAGGGLRHRIDLGAVRLDLGSAADVERAYRELSPFGTGVIVQPMAAPGVACVVEMVEDPQFGPIVGFGLGGVAMELVGDRAWRAAPLTDLDAAALVDEPRGAPLLRGFRGAAPVDRAALAELLVRVGRLVDEHPEIRSLSLNPVLARPDGFAVLHGSVQVGAPGERGDPGPRRLRGGA
ncbi:acyl-CoA synthetase (NDP forming)/GNAT superfamily N-acetyltransferase [Catenuloplanes nepalensis]|uniref:Acyl-CoA synthetase (NDP forming)/GNAT superfamily N-acetyltransferase n=1 Tax=Catenuloplanes nepalensis TaxID=587533 RepID=A0ABT9MZW3_9ACTN|nr:bifunctional GNAT family N-acetyltransferase/acetate--CoA ligase family protein [Catenuloplanes nepalensis]MDP9796987.1 acyl-CoA synthetase (NDP forming)/GNAT superfamily N-acetyltransferase [Catenuloplanes nepalensis]